jgi:hypothetical protein
MPGSKGKWTRESFTIALVILTIISGSIPLLIMTSENASGAVLFVGAGSTYSRINDAIENSSTGDIIIIGPGTFNESVSISMEGITLMSNASSHTVIDPVDKVPALAAMASNVTLMGLNIGDAGMIVNGANFTGYNLVLNTSETTGAFMDGVANLTLNNITIVGTENIGIRIRGSNSINITKVRASGANEDVITIKDSNDIKITSSSFGLNSTSNGIKLDNVREVVLRQNSFSSTGGGNNGILLENGTNVQIRENTFDVGGNSSTVRGTRNLFMSGNTVDVTKADSSGMVFDSCSNLTITFEN